MQFPKDKMKFSIQCQGKESPKGWLVLDIRNVDLDGVSELCINLDDVEKLKTRSTEQEDVLKNLRDLLS